MRLEEYKRRNAEKYRVLFPSTAFPSIEPFPKDSVRLMREKKKP